jgi:hypothetical protein
LIWLIIYVAIAIAQYFYFNGNCYFDKYRMLNEDHQMDDKNYLLGLFVLILSSVDIFLNFSWYDVFFKRNERYTAFAMLIAMVIINIVITILIGLTDACVGDYLTNRKYISIGLYLIYDVWLCIATLIMLINNRKVDVS